MVFNKYCDVLNDMYKALRRIDFVADNEDDILDSFRESIKEKEERVTEQLYKQDHDDYTYADFQDLFELTYKDFTDDFWKKVIICLRILLAQRLPYGSFV